MLFYVQGGGGIRKEAEGAVYVRRQRLASSRLIGPDYAHC